MKRRGFTLIELMVAMVVGLAAVTSVYTLGAAMSKQFYVEQRVASSQGMSRVATMELRRDISRAGLFGTPNADLERACDPAPPQLPQLGGGSLPVGAFQYYADQDLGVLDPNGDNPGARADRLRVLTSLYLSEQLLVHSTSIDGGTIVLQAGNQAYRRTFGWGQTAGPFTTGTAPTYLTGTLDWNSAWGGETASWKGIAQTGARAFQSGSILHIESPEGRHFFRSVFGKDSNAQNQIRMTVTPVLPIGTACLPGAAEGSTVAPLQWVEYAVVDPFDTNADGTDDFMVFDGMFYIDLNPANPAFALQNATASDFLESPNRVLVRRILDATTGNPRPNSTQVIAEFVTHFEVSFLVDDNSGTAQPPQLTPKAGTTDQSAINTNPERIRSVIIDLGVRSPLEDSTLEFTGSGTRFEVDPSQKGSARVRQRRIEIPVMSIARRNL